MIRQTTEIADSKGYVKVRDTYQTEPYDDVYAVGIAAAVDVPLADRPRGRDPQDRPAHGADGARGGQEHRRPDQGGQPQAHKAFGDIPAVCVLDAGNNGVRILVDKMLPPRKHSLLIPGRNRTP